MILRDNEKNINVMNRKLDGYVSKEEQMEDMINSIADTMENEIKTNRSNEESISYQMYTSCYLGNLFKAFKSSTLLAANQPKNIVFQGLD
jgi:hypothetical protein